MRSKGADVPLNEAMIPLSSFCAADGCGASRSIGRCWDVAIVEESTSRSEGQGKERAARRAVATLATRAIGVYLLIIRNEVLPRP